MRCQLFAYFDWEQFVWLLERTWRGVNHHRLPVDAIVVVIVVLMSCGWWYCRGRCCYRKGEKRREDTDRDRLPMLITTMMMARLPVVCM